MMHDGGVDEDLRGLCCDMGMLELELEVILQCRFVQATSES